MPKSYIIVFQGINKIVIVQKRTMTIQIRTSSGLSSIHARKRKRVSEGVL